MKRCPLIYILNPPCKPGRRERLAAHPAENDLFPADHIRWVKALSGDWSQGLAWWKAGNGAWGRLMRHVSGGQTLLNGTAKLLDSGWNPKPGTTEGVVMDAGDGRPLVAA